MTEKMLNRAVLVALIVQIAFILGMNVFRADAIIDFDSSSAYMHEMEMGSQGTIFPSEYSYQASLDLDGAAVISALLYRFTGNIFLSRGIANNLVVLLYLCVVGGVLGRAGLSTTWKRFGILLFFIPYSMIMLGYWRMLFAGGGFYALRALVPLLIIGLVLDIDRGKGFRKYAFRAALTLLIVFLTGLSSGVYVMMCAVCPLILWEAVSAFLKGDYRRMLSRRTALAAAAVLAALAGMAAQRALGFSSAAGGKYILTSDKWIDALLSCFAGLFELFGGLTVHGQVRLFSLEAAGTAVNFAVTWILIGATVYTAVTSIKKKEISNMKGYVLSLMLVNALMFCFLDLKYGDTVFESRYHLIPMLPSFFLVAMMMEDLPKLRRLNRVQVCTIQVLVIGLFAASMLCGDVQWVFARTALGTEKLAALNRIIEEAGVNTAFVVGDDSGALGRKLRVYSRDTHYIVLNDGAESAFRTTWGGTTRYLDNAMQPGKAAVIASPEAYATLPGYLVAGMEPLTDYEGLQIHVADESRFDCVSGIVAERDRVVDFPYSPGYTYDNAALDDDGALVMKAGGGRLENTYASAAGSWDYAVYYDMAGIDGEAYIEIQVGENAPVRRALDPIAGCAEVDNVVMTGEKSVRFAICAPEGTKLRRIEIRRSA